MKIFFLRWLVMWRRFRRGSRHQREHQMHTAAQAQSLMRRAQPGASWQERAHWMIDVAEWVRREPSSALLPHTPLRRGRQQRMRIVLDWLDANRDSRRLVQATIQKTLREAAGPQFFFTTGLPRESTFFSEMSERFSKLILPRSTAHKDLTALLTSMFSSAADANWLQGLDSKTVARIWKLCADDGINHNFRQQIDEALLYLVTTILSVGIGPEFRQRLEAGNSLHASPFMALRRELEKYLYTGIYDDAALRSVRMLIAVCQAQTDRLYAHLDEHGVSVSLVYCIERMRAQLTRMARLIDLRAAAAQLDQGPGQMQALLADMIAGYHQRAMTRGLMRRSYALLARKMVERNLRYGKKYVVRTSAEYRDILQAAARGGAVMVVAVLSKIALSGSTVPRFFEGVLASLNFAFSFTAIAAVGGVLAARQPLVTSTALAAKMGEIDSADGMRGLLEEAGALLRAQAAAVFGNLLTLIPVMALLAVLLEFWLGLPLLPREAAHATLDGFSLLGLTPLYAAATGVLLWLSSLLAGFADNWFAWHRLRETLTHHRRWVQALGAARAERWASWLERHIAGIVGILSLAVLLGMAPAIAQFFGIPLEIRHVTLVAGELTAALVGLGWQGLLSPEFGWAAAGLLLIGVLNVGVAFACALLLALRVSGISARVRRAVYRQILARLVRTPQNFLLAPRATSPETGVTPEKQGQI